MRTSGFRYGEAKVYGVVACEMDSIKILPMVPDVTFEIPRIGATRCVIACDLICLAIFIIGIRKLKKYETLH